MMTGVADLAYGFNVGLLLVVNRSSAVPCPYKAVPYPYKTVPYPYKTVVS
jgi:hypothetical protein